MPFLLLAHAHGVESSIFNTSMLLQYMTYQFFSPFVGLLLAFYVCLPFGFPGYLRFV